jgi:hypothetical protein
MSSDHLTTLLGNVLTLIVVVVSLYRQSRIKKTVEAVHEETKTANGLSVGKLLDNAEGRRILADIARDDRTVSEQHYVDEISTRGKKP